MIERMELLSEVFGVGSDVYSKNSRIMEVLTKERDDSTNDSLYSKDVGKCEMWDMEKRNTSTGVLLTLEYGEAKAASKVPRQGM